MKICHVCCLLLVVFDSFMFNVGLTRGQMTKPEFLVYWRNATQRTEGSVIPWPAQITYINDLDYLAIDPSKFQLRLPTKVKECVIIKKAIERYTKQFFFDDIKPIGRDDPQSDTRRKIGTLEVLDVNSQNSEDLVCETMPHGDMDETYSILVVPPVEGSKSRAELYAKTVWGLLRGLETFSQLIFNTEPKMYGVQTLLIDDGPRFKHRGFMLDTARHYISVPKIINLLDAMAFNKMNVFHWHMVDDQSFPYVSSEYPQLSNKTAFRPNMVYKPEDVLDIIRYAAERGIRVMPELDTPGHSYAMRYVPKLLTKCYDKKTREPNGDFGPINPTHHETYESLKKLLNELSNVFPDRCFHAGGDEVDFECWMSNPIISKWMKIHNMSNYRELSNYHIKNMYNILSHYGKTILVWQEVFDDGTTLPKDAIIHVWKDSLEQPAHKEVKKVITAGYQTILSSCYYLNYIGYGQDWIKAYLCDPSSGLDDKEEELVLGGEACMWTEFVDDSNLISRSWPRASAVAERLWSPKTVSKESEFMPRLEQMRCRLLARGIEAEPVVGPGYC